MNNEELNLLDSKLREVADNFSMPYNEAAWELMDKKLDKEFGEKKKRKLWFWIVPIAVCGVAAFWLLSGSNKNQQLTEQSNRQIVKKAKVADNTNNEIKAQDKTVNINQSNNIQKTDNHNITNNDSKINVENKILEKSKIEANNESKNAVGKTEVVKINSKKEKLIENKILNKKEIKSNNNAKASESKMVVREINSPEKVVISENKIVDKNGVNIPENASNSLPAITANNPKATVVEPKIDFKNLDVKKDIASYTTAQQHNKYVVNFKKAESEALKIPKPDMSHYVDKQPIKLMDPYQPIPLANRWYLGANIGMGIGYVSNPRIADLSSNYNVFLGLNVSNHVGFQTGVSYGNKNFSMRADQFFYTGNLLWQKYLKSADVSVTTLDIPILVRYQFSEKPNKGLFVTAGFAFSFFKQENYSMNFLWNNGTYGSKYYNYNDYSSGLTMLNASLGYQFPINKRYTLTAEQFIQLPTKKMGEEAIRMSTTSFQVGLRYNFLRRKK